MSNWLLCRFRHRTHWEAVDAQTQLCSALKPKLLHLLVEVASLKTKILSCLRHFAVESLQAAFDDLTLKAFKQRIKLPFLRNARKLHGTLPRRKQDKC